MQMLPVRGLCFVGAPVSKQGGYFLGRTQRDLRPRPLYTELLDPELEP